METIVIQKEILEKEKLMVLDLRNMRSTNRNRKNRSVRIRKLHASALYSPPVTNCCFFTIISIGGNLDYAAVVKRGSELQCLIPDCKLIKPGIYEYSIPRCENYINEKFKFRHPVSKKNVVIKVYKVHIIEQSN